MEPDDDRIPLNQMSAQPSNYSFQPSQDKKDGDSTPRNPPLSGGFPGPHMGQPIPPASGRHHVLRYWPREGVSAFIAVALLVAIIAILARYNGQQVPQWPLSISLNSLIALLSTFQRAAMLVAVAEVISQVKWTWLSQPRPLIHLRDFDQASRGVTGSIKLLFSAPKSFLGVVAAVVTILSLAIGPFTQQAIRTVQCHHRLDDSNASLPIAHFVPTVSSYYRIAAGEWEVAVDMKGAMINGITSPYSNISTITPICETGNCTFPRYNGITHSSIGLCSACIDTTSLVSGPAAKSNYTLPNNQWISPVEDSAYLNVRADNLSWASSLFSADFASLASGAITNVTALSLSQAPCQNQTGTVVCPHNLTAYFGAADYVATSCALYPCLKNFNATLHKGVLKETLVSTVPATLNYLEAGISPNETNASANYTAVQSPCQLDGVQYDVSNFSAVPTDAHAFSPVLINGSNSSVPDECLYKMEWFYGSALNLFMGSTLFAGECVYDSRQAGHLWCGDSWWLPLLYNNQDASFDTLNTAFDHFATAVTNKFRTAGTSNYGGDGNEAVQGAVIETTSCIQFDARWLLLPVILMAATAVLLILIIIESYRNPMQPVWKSSLLPLLFFGFRDPNQAPEPAMNLDQLDGYARRMQTRFQAGMDAGFVDMDKDHEMSSMEHDAGTGDLRQRR